MEPLRLTLIGARPYYEEVRPLCHAVKDGDRDAIREAARRLAGYVPTQAVLIPVPSHGGEAGVTLELCRAIQRETMAALRPALVADVLRSNPHRSFNDLKHEGVTPTEKDITVAWKSFADAERIRQARRIGYQPVLVDNVVDTGVTARACMKVTGEIPVLCIGDTKRSKIN